jgi:Ser/Thr protein kinase RdoA (MazF antagonist)
MSVTSVVPANIAAAYGLERVSVVGQFESYGNDNWLVEDGGARRFVLRRHRLNADVERIEFQLALQRHLAQNGFPTSEVVETRAGGDFVIDDDGTPWVLSVHVEGDEYDFANLQQMTAAARSLPGFT